MSPDFKKTARMAAKTLETHNIFRLPVDPFAIIDQHENWRAMTYEEFGKLNGLDEESVIKQIGSKDGCAFYDADEDRYLVIYNDNPIWINISQRITWTIIHEIGHIVLNHLKESGEAMLLRAALSEGEYSRLEAEAEFFAANILAPAPVIYKLGLSSYGQVMKICGISKKAALNRLKHIEWRFNQKQIFKEDLIVESIFYNFINQKKCNSCGHGLILPEAKYCPICGGELIWGEAKMITYGGYQLDQNSKALVCPRCQNGKIPSGDYCDVCGTYLINKCADFLTEDQRGYDYVKESCGSLTPGHARFCTHCGNPTTFNTNQLLPHWEVEKAQIEATKPKLKAVPDKEDLKRW